MLWKPAGIAVVFSAGNNGPGTSTITKPKNINTNNVNVMCTAAIDGASYLAEIQIQLQVFQAVVHLFAEVQVLC